MSMRPTLQQELQEARERARVAEQELAALRERVRRRLRSMGLPDDAGTGTEDWEWEAGAHDTYQHREDGRVCVRIERPGSLSYWFVPYDAGGEGVACEREHGQEKVLAEAVRVAEASARRWRETAQGARREFVATMADLDEAGAKLDAREEQA